MQAHVPMDICDGAAMFDIMQLCEQVTAPQKTRMPRYNFSGFYCSWSVWRNCTG